VEELDCVVVEHPPRNTASPSVPAASHQRMSHCRPTARNDERLDCHLPPGVGDRAKLALKLVRVETGSITHLTESTKAPGRPEHHPAAIWLVGAISALVGFVLVDVMPITALLLTVVLIAGLLGLSALPSLRGRRHFSGSGLRFRWSCTSAWR
jgi:hypothetical protein